MDHAGQVKVSAASMDKTSGKSSQANPAAKSSQAGHSDRSSSSRGRDARQAGLPEMSHVGLVPCDPSMTNQMLQSWYNYSMYNMFLNAVANQAAVADMVNRSQMQLMPDLTSPKQQQPQHKKGSASTSLGAAVSVRHAMPNTHSSTVTKGNIATATSALTRKPTQSKKDAPSLSAAASRTVPSRHAPSLSASHVRRDVGKDGHVRRDVHSSPRASSSATGASIPNRNVIPAHCKKDTNKLIDDLIHKAYGRSNLPSPKSVVPAHSVKEITSVPDRTRDNYQHAFRPRACTSRQMTDPASDIPKSSQNQSDSDDTTSVLDLSKSRNVTSSSNNCQNKSEQNYLTCDKEKCSSSLFTTRRPDHKNVRGILAKRPRIMDNPYLQKVCAAGMKTVATSSASSESTNNNMLKLESTEVSSMIDRLFKSVGESSSKLEAESELKANAETKPASNSMDVDHPCNEVSSSEFAVESDKVNINSAVAEGRPEQTSPASDNQVSSCDNRMETSPPLSQSESQNVTENVASQKGMPVDQGTVEAKSETSKLGEELNHSDSDYHAKKPEGQLLVDKFNGSIESALSELDTAPQVSFVNGPSSKTESVTMQDEIKQSPSMFVDPQNKSGESEVSKIPELHKNQVSVSDGSELLIASRKEEELEDKGMSAMNQNNFDSIGSTDNVESKSAQMESDGAFSFSKTEAAGSNTKTKIILSETEGTFSVSKDESSESDNDFSMNVFSDEENDDGDDEKDQSEPADSLSSVLHANSMITKGAMKRPAEDLLESEVSVKFGNNESDCGRGEDIYKFSASRSESFTPPLASKTWNFRESVRRADLDKNKMPSDSDSDVADRSLNGEFDNLDKVKKDEVDNSITKESVNENEKMDLISLGGSGVAEFKSEVEDSNQNLFEDTGGKSFPSDISVTSSIGSEQVLSDCKDVKDDFYAFPSTSSCTPSSTSKRGHGRGHRGKRGRKKRDDSSRKPHICQKCGLGFTREGDLERHKRSHLGQKLYVCEYCQKSFVRGYYYKLHVSLHEVNEAPESMPNNALSEKLDDVSEKDTEAHSSSGESSDLEEEHIDGSTFGVEEPESDSEEKPLKTTVSDTQLVDSVLMEEVKEEHSESPVKLEPPPSNTSMPAIASPPSPSPNASPTENGHLEKDTVEAHVNTKDHDEAVELDKESPLKITSVVSLSETAGDNMKSSEAGPSAAPGVETPVVNNSHDSICDTAKISNGVRDAFLDVPIKSESPGLKIASVTSLPPEMAETKFGIKMLEQEPPKPSISGRSSCSIFGNETKASSKPIQQDGPKPSVSGTSSYSPFISCNPDSKDVPKPTSFKREFFDDLSSADSVSRANFLANAGLTVDTNITANYANSTMVTATPETDFSLILNTDPIPCTPSDFIFPDDEMFSNSPKEYLDLDTTTRPKASDIDPMKLLHVDSMIKFEPNNEHIVMNVKVEPEVQFDVLNRPVEGVIKKEIVDVKPFDTNPCSPLSGLNLNDLGVWDDSETEVSDDLSYRPNGADIGCKPKKRGSRKGVKKPRKAKFLHRFKCKQCPKDFARYGDLKKHESQHTGENLSVCEFCGKVFLRRCFYLIHLQRHRGGKYIHHPCGLRFPSKTALKTHMRFCKKHQNLDNKDVKCFPSKKIEKSDISTADLIDQILPSGLKHENGEMRNCNNNIYPKTKFEDLDIKREDIEEKVAPQSEDNGEYTCGICGKKYIWLSALVYHKRCHTGEKPYKCPQCGKTFRAAGTLRIHIRYHNNERPFVCEKCGKRYTEKGTLKSHMRTHSGERKFKCPYCGKSFAWREHMRYHIKIHTGERPHKCEECDKRFPDRGSLKVHWRSHTNERPYSCEVCQRRYKSSKQLRIHHRTHTGEKPFSCSDCKMRFRALGNLKRHSLTHTREKPYKCTFCPKGFRSHSNLNEHMNIHTGNKPHCCKLCDKKFANSGSLAKHIATHSDEKPFCCDICKKCFRDKGDLKSHMRSHTNERPYPCPVCGQRFKHKCHITKHMRTHTRKR